MRLRLPGSAVFVCALVLVVASMGGARALVPEVEPPSLEPAGPAPTTVQTAASGEPLSGLFGIAEGQCAGGGVTAGSSFRMVQPGGNPQAGPFVENTDSPCGDNTYTPLRPGSDGGLSTTGYQPHPSPAFQGTGHGANDQITQPQSFFGTRFATATNPTDPQTGTEVPVPSVTNDGGTLTGDVRAFAAAWNSQHFNQGSPKPNGERPGNTAGPEGTYNAATGAYTLTWSSQIVGGPFNNFTGVWRLEGTFEGGVQVGVQSGELAGPGGTQTQGTGATGTGGTGAARGVGGAVDPTPRTGAPNPAPAGVLLLLLALGLRRMVLRTAR